MGARACAVATTERHHQTESGSGEPQKAKSSDSLLPSTEQLRTLLHTVQSVSMRLRKILIE